MPRINGGEMLVRALEREGVHEVFALHGGHLDAIFKACREHDLRVIDTRHEQAAAHMADGWARATGRPGVAMVTAGPGVTDAVTGVANAYLDAIPMILIGGRSPLLDDELLPLQGGIDQVGLMRPITKWARSVTHTERIPEYVAMAFRQAVSGRPGPVFLELPIDVLFARAEEEKVVFPENYRPKSPAGPSFSRSRSKVARDHAALLRHAQNRPISLPTAAPTRAARNACENVGRASRSDVSTLFTVNRQLQAAVKEGNRESCVPKVHAPWSLIRAAVSCGPLSKDGEPLTTSL